jgi:hypothetical protein
MVHLLLTCCIWLLVPAELELPPWPRMRLTYSLTGVQMGHEGFCTQHHHHQHAQHTVTMTTARHSWCLELPWHFLLKGHHNCNRNSRAWRSSACRRQRRCAHMAQHLLIAN